MKQIIEKYPDGKISHIWYLNDKNQLNGLKSYYQKNGLPIYKTNFINDKFYGLDSDYDKEGNLKNQRYFL